MPHRLFVFRDRLLGTLWFLPATLVAVALALAAGMVELSAHVDAHVLARWPRVFGANAGSSRSILAAVAGGMITVAGLSFSLTVVAVTQASSQYTPRVLRNFMRDRANQVVLGTFVGIFAYCLVVLRTIRGADEGPPFVPALAVVLGIALAVVGIGVLIFFVHHIASTLDASSLLARIARDTAAAIDALYPDALDDGADDAQEAATRAAAAAAPAWRAVPAPATGYVQGVDVERLAALAGDAGRLVRMERGVGDFVIEGRPMAAIALPATDARRDGPRGGAPTTAHAAAPNEGGEDTAPGDLDALARRLAGVWEIGEYRTVEQDAAFGLRQLVDVALKALSPGVNDTTTAVSCVDYLGALLVRLAPRRIGRPVHEGPRAGRVLTAGPSFERLLRLACDEIRQNAAGNVTVLHRLLGALAEVATATGDAGRRRLIGEQMTLLGEVAERTVPAPDDLERLRRAHADALRAVQAVRPVAT